jgi:hypothetical protein
MYGKMFQQWQASLSSRKANSPVRRRRLFLESLEDRRVLAAVVYVDDDWASLSPGTAVGPGNAYSIGTSAFSTLQAGLTAVDAGGAVNVQDGTYTVSSQQIINKSMSIVGQSQAGTIVQVDGYNTPPNDDQRGLFLVTAAVDLDVSTITFDGNSEAGWKVWDMFRHYGSGTFDQVTFRDIQYEAVGGYFVGRAYQGVGVSVIGDAENVDITNSTFLNIGRAGAIYSGTVTGTFARNSYTGKGPSDPDNDSFHMDYAVDIGAGAVVVVEQNTIVNNQGIARDENVDAEGFIPIDSAAILASTYYGDGTQVTVQNNILNNNSVGIWVGYSALDNDQTSIDIYNNDLAGNTLAAIVSIDPDVVVDASGNWFGATTNYPTWSNYDVYNYTYGAIDFTPYLTVGTDVDSGTPGFQGDFSQLSITVLGEQSSTQGRVAEAVEMATAGGTVLVFAGDYAGPDPIDDAIYLEPAQVVVNKNLTLTGTPLTATPIPQISPSFSTGDGSSGDNAGWFLIQAGNSFNVNNLIFDGNGQQVWQGLRFLGTGTIDNATFRDFAYNSTPTEPYSEGAVAVLTSSGSVVVTNSDFEYSNFGVYVENSSASITSATVTGNAIDVVVAGTSGADAFTVGPTGVSHGAGPKTTTIDATITSLAVLGLASQDTFAVSPSSTAEFFIDGGLPSGTSGDTLTFTTPAGQSVTDTGSSLTASGSYEPVFYQAIEVINLAGTIIVEGSGDDDLLDLSGTSETAGSYQMTLDVTGTPFVGPTVNFTGLTSFTFNGMAGNDAFSLTQPSLDFLNPTSGIAYNGGSDTGGANAFGSNGDAWRLLSPSSSPETASTVTHRFDASSTPANGNDGLVTIADSSLSDGATTLAYTGLSSIRDTMANIDREFNATAAGSETVTLQDDGSAGNNWSQIGSDLSALVTFLSPSGELSISTTTGSGDDVIAVQGVDSAFSANLSITGDATDVVAFQTTATNVGGGTLQATGKAVSVNANLTAGGDITLTAQETNGTGDDIVVGSSVTMTSTTGNILLEAGDDFSVASTATLVATGATRTVTLTSLDTSADVPSSTFNVAGDFDSTSAIFNGSNVDSVNNGDVFNLTPDKDTSGTLTPFQIFGQAPTVYPGDGLTLDITGLTDATLTVGPTPNAGVFTFSNAANVTYTSLENVVSIPTPVPVNLVVDLTTYPAPPAGESNSLQIGLNSAGTELLIEFFNGSSASPITVFQGDDNPLNSLTILGSANSETIVFNTNSAGQLPTEGGGLLGASAMPTPRKPLSQAFLDSGRTPNTPNPPAIFYNGQDLGGTDLLIINLAANGSTVDRDAAYFSDNNGSFFTNNGDINIVPLSGPLVGMTMTGADLPTIVFEGAGGSLLVDATSTPATSNLTISDDGTPNDGVSTISGDGGFETTRFSGFDTLTVRGGTGGEFIDLVGLDGSTTAPRVTTVLLDGDNTTNNDTGADTLQVRSVPTGVAVTLLGGLGSDNFWLFNQNTAADVANTVNNIQGTVIVSPTAQENTPAGGDTDSLMIVDRADATGDSMTVTSTTIDGIFDSGSGVDVTYDPDRLDVVTLIGTDGADTITLNFGGVGGTELDTFTVNGAGDRDHFVITSDTAAGVTTTINGDEVASAAPNSGPNNDLVDFSSLSSPRTVTLTAHGAIDGFTGTEPSILGAGSTFTNVDALLAPAGTGDALIMGIAAEATHWDIGGNVAGFGPYGSSSFNLTNSLSNSGVVVGNSTTVELTGNNSAIGRPTAGNPVVATGAEDDLAWGGFENLTGAAAADDRFDFRAGASVTGTIDGRGGSVQGDSLDYRDYTTAVTVELASGTATGTGGLLTGTGGDSGSSIENVFGGNGADTITGDQDNNILGDGHGSDTLEGGVVSDVSGNDTFRLEPGLNEDGTGSSADVITDLNGTDTVDFRFADYGIVVDMDLLNVAQDVFVTISGTQTVRLSTLSGQDPITPSGFENIIGSQYNDTIGLNPLVLSGNVPPVPPPTVRHVDGNSPPGAPVGGGSADPIPPGDTWNFDAAGLPVYDNGFSVSLGGLAAVTYQSIETLKTANSPPRILDDGDDEYTEFPTWASSNVSTFVDWNQVTGNGGYNNDYRFNYADTNTGSMKDTHFADWTFYGLTPGSYRVAVSYPDPALSPQPNSLATDAQFSVLDSGRMIARVDVNQQVKASSFTDAGVPWHELGIFTIRSHTLGVELKDNADGIVLADAVRIERVNEPGQGTASVPVSTGGELTVFQGSLMLRDGASVLAQTTSVTNPVTQDYIIRNDGAGPLTIDNIALAMQGGRPDNYTLSIPAMPLTLASGASSTFSITLNATTDAEQGDFPAQLRIFSNDFDENVVMTQGSTGIPYPADPTLDVDPFTVDIRGVVTNYSIIDNDSLSGFVTTGDWSPSTANLGYGGNQLSTSADGTGETAIWTFTGLPAGTYRVSATWEPTANTPAATNAPFTVTVNGVANPIVTVNQSIAPATFSAQDAGWYDLGSPVIGSNASNTISVMLTDNAPSIGARVVIADAIRVERLFSDASTLPPFVTTEPDLQVTVGATDVPDDTGVVDFGTTFGGSTQASLTKTFVLANVGGADLTITQPIRVPTGYAVVSLDGVTPPDGSSLLTIAPGSSAELVIRMDTGLPGELEGTVWIQSNDPDENLFNFDVTGVIRTSQIVDNLDSPPDLVNNVAGFNPGSFVLFTNNRQGYNERIHSVTAGAGSPAQWVFPGLTPGRQYLVSATWTGSANRVSTAQYTLTTATSTNVTVNQQVAPSQRQANGHVFDDLGVVTADGSGILTVSLSASVGTGVVVADAIRILPLEQPEIEVFQGSTLILDSSTSVDFGTTAVGSSVDRAFSISNLGLRPMALGVPEVPTGYSIVGSFPTSVEAGGSASFTIRLTGAAVGRYDGTLRFGADEANENPFEIVLKGSVVDIAADTIIDNTIDSAPLFTVSGAFTTFTGQGRNNSIHAATGANATPSVATYTFSGLAANTIYRVSATWSPALNRATNAPFTISGVSGGPYSSLINQELAPSDYNADGSLWQDLGGPFTTTGDTLIVSLTNTGANEYVVADAIRIEPLPAQSVIRLYDSDGIELLNGGRYEFVGTTLGSPVSATFTVMNAGNSTLTLDAASLADALLQAPEFSLQTALGSTSLAPGASTTFTVEMLATFAEGPATTIVLGSNDEDANPFLLTLTGRVVIPASVVDDGDFGAGYSESGPNLPIQVIAGSGGYGNDYRQIAANSNNTAVYTFVGLTPNTSYRVGATWVSGASRSSVAPLTVSGVLGGDVDFLINQTVAPSDYTQDGSFFSTIGVFRTTGTTLTVSWGSAASGVVIADAVHLLVVDPGPEVQVVGSPNVANGGSVDLGRTTLNSTFTKTYTISNQGSDPLDLGPTLTLPAGFSLSDRSVATLFDGTSTTIIQPNGDPVTFTLSVDTSTLGDKSGTVSFGTNDPDENPFSFSITVAVDPTTVVIDNNGPYSPAPLSGVYSDTGNLSYYSNQGFMSDVREIASGATTRSATYTFSGLTSGAIYMVGTTWTAFSNRSTAAPYTIDWGGGSPTTVTVNQQQAPNDFSDQGASWETLGTFTLSGTTLTVTISGAASGNVIADAVRIERVFGPEIGVTYDGGASVSVGDTVNMGSVVEGAPALSRTFTITNQGASNLTISGTLTPPPGFTLTGVTSGLFGGSDATITPGSTASFTVNLLSTTVGVFSWPISFGTNDSDENPFTFTVTGTVTAPVSTKQIIDNNGPTSPSPLAGTYTDSGNLGYWTGQGYLSDVREATTTNFAAKSATYTFSGLATGARYLVAATWTSFSNRATSAPYIVSGVSGGPQTVLINQRIAPNDFADEGVNWETLGSFETTGSSLTVVLGGSSTGSVIADAVRLERLVGAEIGLQTDGTNVNSGDAVALGQTLVGNTLRRTFTIQNQGEGVLEILGGGLTLPAGFSLVPSSDPTNPPTPSNLFSSSVNIAGGGSATFTLAVDTSVVANYSGNVSFTNSDANESPFTFSISASVAGAAIIDNGDVGSTNTGYTRYSGIGYANDVHYALNPTSAVNSTWTFTGLSAGVYRVSATWVAHPNRATNASFTVSSSIGSPPTSLTTTVNQRIAPTGITVGTSNFQDLFASFNHSGGNLVVTLTTLGADGFVIADAIRVAAPGTLLVGEAAGFIDTDDSLVARSVVLTHDDVKPVLTQAIDYWSQIDPTAAAKLNQVEVIIDDLPGSVLGLGEFGYPTIWLDRDAASYGWRLGSYESSLGQSTTGRVDLLSVVTHELGHVLNLPDLDATLYPTHVMAGILPVGASRVERIASASLLEMNSKSGWGMSRDIWNASVLDGTGRTNLETWNQLGSASAADLFSALIDDEASSELSRFWEAVDAGESLVYEEARSRRRLQPTVDAARDEKESLIDAVLADWQAGDVGDQG